MGLGGEIRPWLRELSVGGAKEHLHRRHEQSGFDQLFLDLGAKGGQRRYLRRIPRDPFAAAGKPAAEQWVLRGYQDEIDSIVWGGKDIYDVRSASEGIAIDETRHKDW